MAQKIPFTDREMKRGWRTLYEASRQDSRNNAHRLLLLYAIECGLKAVYLRRQGRNLFEVGDINKTGHDLKEITKELKLGANIDLPSFKLNPIYSGKSRQERKGEIDALHQAWRYGGELLNNPSDSDMEKQLEALQILIQKELQS